MLALCRISRTTSVTQTEVTLTDSIPYTEVRSGPFHSGRPSLAVGTRLGPSRKIRFVVVWAHRVLSDVVLTGVSSLSVSPPVSCLDPGNTGVVTPVAGRETDSPSRTSRW